MAFLTYTVLRVALLLAVAGALALLGVRGWLLVLLALFVSGFVSLFVLRRSRDQASIALSNRLGSKRPRVEEPPDDEPDSAPDR